MPSPSAGKLTWQVLLMLRFVSIMTIVVCFIKSLPSCTSRITSVMEQGSRYDTNRSCCTVATMLKTVICLAEH